MRQGRQAKAAGRAERELLRETVYNPPPDAEGDMVTETLATLACDISQSEGYDEQFDCAVAAMALRDALLYFVAPAPDRDALRDEDYPGIARALDDYGAALLSQALVNSEREADRLAGEAEAALRRTTIR
jgi:hypothetical protein